MGSNIDGFWRVGSKLLVGAMPMEPAKAAARSERMSACCRLVSARIYVTCCSDLPGW
jgi:hypothetical protein